MYQATSSFSEALHLRFDSYLQHFRSSLLAAQTTADFEGFLHQQVVMEERPFVALSPFVVVSQNSVNMRKIVALMYTLRRSAPPGALECGASGEAKAASWPLRKGGYPSFHRFSEGVVDFQQQERERLLLEEGELRRTRQLERELWERLTAFNADNKKWAHQQQVDFCRCCAHAAT